MTNSGEPVDVAVKSRHADRVGDKRSKYWDHNERRWVACPTPADEARIPEQAEPAQSADESTVVGTAQ